MCISDLLASNNQWAANMANEEAELMASLATGQSPNYLWIGCADSRVPETTILNRKPGDVFVHRNIANLVKDMDMSVQSVLTYAIDVLQVEHVIVCGHYQCGGVKVAMGQDSVPIIDNWLRSVKQSCVTNAEELAAIDDEGQRFDRMCELNVADQVTNLSQNPIVQKAWQRGQSLQIHGWIYDVADGKLSDLGLSLGANSPVNDIYIPKI